MSHEYNPGKQPVIPWQTDEQGNYIRFNFDGNIYDARPDTSSLYLFPEQPDIDHLFIPCDEIDDDGRQVGYYLFRQDIEGVFGEGGFGVMVDQMVAVGFAIADGEEPDQSDIANYEDRFGRLPTPGGTCSEDELVLGAMAGLDDEWRYYSAEDNWS